MTSGRGNFFKMLRHTYTHILPKARTRSTHDMQLYSIVGIGVCYRHLSVYRGRQRKYIFFLGKFIDCSTARTNQLMTKWCVIFPPLNLRLASRSICQSVKSVRLSGSLSPRQSEAQSVRPKGFLSWQFTFSFFAVNVFYNPYIKDHLATNVGLF